MFSRSKTGPGHSRIFAVALSAMLMLMPSLAWADYKSTYTKLNLDTDCEFFQSDDMGGQARCKGFRDLPVYFAEGDLRQMVQFGFVSEPFLRWESFGEFNRINETIEWRLKEGLAFATILRWFIENHDDKAGMPTKRTEGQVLVISKVAGNNSEKSCIVGYVDARANADANEIARDVADTLAGNFLCGTDLPEFHGNRGKFSGNPTIIAN